MLCARILTNLAKNAATEWSLPDPVDSTLGRVPEPPAVLPDEEFAAIDSVLRNSLSYYGLDTYYPTGLLRMFLDSIHSTTCLPWWESIVIYTVIIRIATVPFLIMNMKIAERAKAVAPESKKYAKQMQDALKSGDMYHYQVAIQEQMEFQKKHGISIGSQLKRLVPNMAVFLSSFIALRAMATAPIESFKTEGALWFPDLTATDPYWYALSTACGVSMHLLMRLGIETGSSVETMERKMRMVMLYGMPAMIVLASSFFPTALSVYWVTSNLMALTLSAILKTAPMKRLFNIPTVVVKKQLPKRPVDTVDRLSFVRNPALFLRTKVSTIKKWWKDTRNKPLKDSDIDRMDREAFRDVTKRPPQKLYPYNPKEKYPDAFDKGDNMTIKEKFRFWKKSKSQSSN